MCYGCVDVSETRCTTWFVAGLGHDLSTIRDEPVLRDEKDVGDELDICLAYMLKHELSFGESQLG